MMDDRLFEEMLQEIDAMTSEEYWSLYREAEKLANFPPEEYQSFYRGAEKLANFPPEDTSFIPVQFTAIPAVNFHHNFDNTFTTETIPILHNYCQENLLDGDDVWPKAA